MDERKAELKALKKAWRKAKSRATLCYRFLAFICLVLCVLFMGLGGAAYLPQAWLNCVPMQCLSQWGEQLCAWLGVADSMLLPMVSVPAAIFAFLGLGCVVMWILGGQKVRKSDEYLSWRTLRETLRSEKELQ